MRKKFLLCATTMLCAFCFFTGCGEKETQDNTTQQVDTQENNNSEKEKEEVVEQTLEEIYAQILDKVELPTMERLEDDYITNYYGLDISLFEEYVFAAAEDPLLAEHITLIKMKEGESNEDTAKFLENFIEQKKNEFESYLPEQAKVVEKGEVVTKGNYIVLVISSQKDAVEAQLPEALK